MAWRSDDLAPASFCAPAQEGPLKSVCEGRAQATSAAEAVVPRSRPRPRHSGGSVSLRRSEGGGSRGGRGCAVKLSGQGRRSAALSRPTQGRAAEGGGASADSARPTRLRPPRHPLGLRRRRGCSPASPASPAPLSILSSQRRHRPDRAGTTRRSDGRAKRRSSPAADDTREAAQRTGHQLPWPPSPFAAPTPPPSPSAAASGADTEEAHPALCSDAGDGPSPAQRPPRRGLLGRHSLSASSPRSRSLLPCSAPPPPLDRLVFDLRLFSPSLTAESFRGGVAHTSPASTAAVPRLSSPCLPRLLPSPPFSLVVQCSL